MDEPTPDEPDELFRSDERSRHDQGREAQPSHAADVELSAGKAERLEHHARQAEDDQGIGGQATGSDR